jgi:hypothetical protein
VLISSRNEMRSGSWSSGRALGYCVEGDTMFDERDFDGLPFNHCQTTLDHSTLASFFLHALGSES